VEAAAEFKQQLDSLGRYGTIEQSNGSDSYDIEKIVERLGI
jgi:hypothetical protein